MANKIKNTIGQNEDIPIVLSWKQIQKKYPEKWVLLGCLENAPFIKVKSEILFVGDTNEELTEFWLKNALKFKKKGIYKFYTFRHIAQKKTIKIKKNMLVSTRKVTK
jgi:hypothetical protein